LQLHLREFEYRHNLRKQPLQMIELLLQAFPKVRVEVQEPSAFDPKSEP
jgi:transposase